MRRERKRPKNLRAATRAGSSLRPAPEPEKPKKKSTKKAAAKKTTPPSTPAPSTPPEGEAS